MRETHDEALTAQCELRAYLDRMNRIAPLLLACTLAITCRAQTEAEREVLSVIDRFFGAMTARDTVAMAETLVREGVLQAFTPNGQSPVRTVTNADYLVRLAQGKERYVERYWYPLVRIDGPLATVTTPYDFHIDGAFSHCGVDIFTLVKGSNGWRVTNCVYTRQTADCPPSPLGPFRN